jgi:acyl-CoA hydrolase
VTTHPIKLDLGAAVDLILGRSDAEVRLALPLGLGKPNALANAVYERVAADPTRSLRIYTALSLTMPRARDPLGRAFLDPFRERHWGPGYVEPAYALAAQRDRLPPNVRVHEFYFQAASGLGSTAMQRDYRSLNYTHVAESLLAADVRFVIQLIAVRGDGAGRRYSLSCNPDLTGDVIDLFKSAGKPLTVIGVVHPDLPFLGGDAEVGPETFAALVDEPTPASRLFAMPRMPVSSVDHAVGFHASRLIADAGTLQIGIGSLSDAVVAALLMRQRRNDDYRRLAAAAWSGRAVPEALTGGDGPFAVGLYGLSEMVMDGFMHLRKAGILRREVLDEREGSPAYLHGAFALGSKDFYDWLRSLDGDDFSGLRMSRVSRVNDVYDPNETALRGQRAHARFLNTCMQVNALGGAASDTLPDGRVVSGVGGQYNFVAMAHELRGARSVMMLRSTRMHEGRLISNIVWSHPQLTIPRHLRDVVVTEYGAADLRGKTDEETIIALLQITDAAFQDELADTAKRHRKLAKDYRVPDAARRNTRAEVERFVAEGQALGAFAPFPFGSDFTPVEERLALALDQLKEALALPRWAAVRRATVLAARGLSIQATAHAEALERMGLTAPRTLAERLRRCLLLATLAGKLG